MITTRSLLYIAVIQFAFSSLDIFARSSLRNQAEFWSAITGYWFPLWLLLQAAIAPFQIRLITRHGLGRGVALMNAFSVLYALIGGLLILNESASLPQCISAVLVVVAVWLMLTPKKSRHSSPSVISASITVLGTSNHEQENTTHHRRLNTDESYHYSYSEPIARYPRKQRAGKNGRSGKSRRTN